MKVRLTKELKVELLQALRQGYLDTDNIDKLTGKPSAHVEIDEDKLEQIEKILYPD